MNWFTSLKVKEKRILFAHCSLSVFSKIISLWGRSKECNLVGSVDVLEEAPHVVATEPKLMLSLDEICYDYCGIIEELAKLNLIHS